MAGSQASGVSGEPQATGRRAADGHAQPPAPWWVSKRDRLLAIAERGPAYVYDLDSIDASVDELRSGVGVLDRLFYAVKANPNPGVIDRLARHGLGFECVSFAEIERVRAVAGDAPVLFTPNFAPRSEYERAFALGALVTVDCLHPLEHWPEVFRGREILVRLDAGQGRGHHPHVRTAGAESKFGISPDLLEAARSAAQACGTTVVGLHAHSGSGILEPDAWADNARLLASSLRWFPDARILDVGGGLGVPEHPGQQGLDVEEIGRQLARFEQANEGLKLWMEPGRFLVARAGVLLARVTQLKRKGARRFVGVEVGMNALLRPALYGSWHQIVNLTRLGEPETAFVDVVGPICESGDVLGRERMIAEPSEGDTLLLANAGAYGCAMSSSYNLRAPPAEVLIEG